MSREIITSFEEAVADNELSHTELIKSLARLNLMYSGQMQLFVTESEEA